MRHDPASAALVVMLCGLKMYGMAQAIGDLVGQGAPAFEAAIPTLSQLLKAELAEREVRSVAYHIKSARFPAYKDLASFDFATSEVNEATNRQLHRSEFTDRSDNVALIGGPGTGKTHVSIAVPDPRPRGRRVEHGRPYVSAATTGLFIHAFIAAVGLMRDGGLDVVGHDVGTWIAYAHAALYPADVRRLVLTDALVPGVLPPNPPVGAPKDVENVRSWHSASIV